MAPARATSSRRCRAGLERARGRPARPAGGRVLDYGCADAPYRRFFAADADYLAADLPGQPGRDARDRARRHGAASPTRASTPCSRPRCSSTSPTRRSTWPSAPRAAARRAAAALHPRADGLPPRSRRLLALDLRRAAAGGGPAPGFEVVRFEGIMGLAATGLQLFQDALVLAPAPAAAPAARAASSRRDRALADRLESARARAASTRWCSRSWRGEAVSGLGVGCALPAPAAAAAAGRPEAAARVRRRLPGGVSSSRSAPTTASSTTTCARSSSAARWRGVMVEPVPVRLRAPARATTAGSTRVALENAAIADRDGDAAVLPPAPTRRRRARSAAATGTTASARSRARRCSRHAGAHPRHRASGIVETEVPALTFDSLCERHGLEPRRPAAGRHRGLRLGDPARASTSRRTARGWSSTSTSTWRPRTGAAARAHLEARRLRDDGGGLRHVLPATPVADELTRLWRRLRPAVAGVSAHEAPDERAQASDRPPRPRPGARCAEP